MSDWRKRLVSQSDLMTLSEQLKKAGKRIVFTAGSWDLIHAGQCRYLEKAKTYGDVLVVGVSSNDAIKRVKGPNKPILDEKIRAEMLSFFLTERHYFSLSGSLRYCIKSLSTSLRCPPIARL